MLTTVRGYLGHVKNLLPPLSNCGQRVYSVDMLVAPEPTPQTLADLLDFNVRANIRTLIAYSQVPTSHYYRALGMSRQRFSGKLNGGSRFTAAEVAMLAHLLGVTADQLYADPAELVRADPTAESSSQLRLRLIEELGPTKRSRCFYLVADEGQMHLPFGVEPELVAV